MRPTITRTIQPGRSGRSMSVAAALALALTLTVPISTAPAAPPAAQEKAQSSLNTAPWELVSWAPMTEGPVFQGTGKDTWDRFIRERGYVLVAPDGTYRLWYTGYASDHPETLSLGHATSRDGLHWDRDPANPIFQRAWTEDVCVVKRAGEYFMFAEGRNDVAHHLTSKDGRKWDDHGPIDIRKVDGAPISPGPYGTPTAWFENGAWYLYYERRDLGVWLASSKDRKTWTNVQDEPVIALGPPGSYDHAQLALNQVVKRGDFYYGFYHAKPDRVRGAKNWTTCVARSRDRIHWEKYPGNPIIENNHSSAVLVRTPDGQDRLYTMHPEVWVYAPRGR